MHVAVRPFLCRGPWAFRAAPAGLGSGHAAPGPAPGVFLPCPVPLFTSVPDRNAPFLRSSVLDALRSILSGQPALIAVGSSGWCLPATLVKMRHSQNSSLVFLLRSGPPSIRVRSRGTPVSMFPARCGRLPGRGAVGIPARPLHRARPAVASCRPPAQPPALRVQTAHLPRTLAHCRQASATLCFSYTVGVSLSTVPGPQLLKPTEFPGDRGPDGGFCYVNEMAFGNSVMMGLVAPGATRVLGLGLSARWCDPS